MSTARSLTSQFAHTFVFWGVVSGSLAAGGAARAATADPPWHRAGTLDLAAVASAVVTPEPKFVRVSKDSSELEHKPSEAEARAATTWDLTQAKRALLFEPRREGSLSVVVMDNLNYPSRPDALRFWQRNPDAEPVTANCGDVAGGRPWVGHWRDRLQPGERAAVSSRSVHSYGIARGDDGEMRLDYRHAWFDFGACKGQLLRSFHTKLTKVAGGLAFAYVTSCPTCAEGERERLNVWMPTYRSVRFDASSNGRIDVFTWIAVAASFSIEPGKSTSFELKVENDAVHTWNRLLDEPLATPPFSWLRVEFVRGTDDPLPVAQVFVR